MLLRNKYSCEIDLLNKEKKAEADKHKMLERKNKEMMKEIDELKRFLKNSTPSSQPDKKPKKKWVLEAFFKVRLNLNI